jgi:two-component system, cell cycle response regulator DivK
MTHILVVEDDPHNAILFRKVLEKRGGFRVTVTEDGAEVIALARSGEVALVLMDVSLAHTRLDGHPVNGVELCRRIKSEAGSALLPVVLATAHAMRGDAEALLVESGADDYISKPIVDHAAFVEQVRRNLAEAA